MRQMDTDTYLRHITPTLGDPTYSVLKAHLIVESKLRDYLDKVLPHPEALKDSRLSFAQLLAVVRAHAPLEPDHWVWDGVKRLNRLRNLLAHQLVPESFHQERQAYVEFVSQKSKTPLPTPAGRVVKDETGQWVASHPTARFTDVDMVTVGLVAILSAFLERGSSNRGSATSARESTRPPSSPSA